ncbi:hypothetical protein EC839_106122 [Pseudomonas sp. JUb52]|nr:hypothetical protein EC839_106122 [Pseudomonas sp. JUb52]
MICSNLSASRHGADLLHHPVLDHPKPSAKRTKPSRLPLGYLKGFHDQVVKLAVGGLNARRPHGPVLGHACSGRNTSARVRRFGLTETIRVGQVGAILTVNTSDVRDLPCPKGTTSPALSAHLVLPNGHNWRSSVARAPQCVISDTVCHSQHSGLEVRKSHRKGGDQSGAVTRNVSKIARISTEVILPHFEEKGGRESP